MKLVRPFLAWTVCLAAYLATSLSLTALTVGKDETSYALTPATEDSIDINEGELIVADVLSVTGNYSQNEQEDVPENEGNYGNPPDPAPGILTIMLDTVPGIVEVDGTAQIAGALKIQRQSDYRPEAGTTYTVLTATGGVNGRFSSYIDETGLGIELIYESNAVKIHTTRLADPDGVAQTHSHLGTTINYTITGTRGVIVDEDWTDGSVDYNWWYPGHGNAGLMPSGREEYETALVHRINHPSFTWGVAHLEVPQVRVGQDDVVIMDFITYSDVAYNNQEFAKPEVALLRNNTRAAFGHDWALEISRHYFTRGGYHQMNPNVENQINWITDLHLAGGDTRLSLLTPDHSLTLFRAEGGSTNTELNGNRRATEVTDTEFMKYYDFIQISMPLNYRDSFSSRDPIFAFGKDLSTAEMGMPYTHVGITHKTDVNLDYVTDALDYIYWRTFVDSELYAINPTRAVPMLWEGDIDNNSDVEPADLAILVTALGIEHDDEYFVSHAPVTFEDIMALRNIGNAPSFHYDGGTGELTMTTSDTFVPAIAITAPAPESQETLPPANSENWWHGYAGGRLSWVDRNGIGIAGNQTLTIATLPKYLSADDFGPIYIGWQLGGGTMVTPTINFVEAPESGFNSWAETIGLEGDDAAPMASPMDDGIPNLLKYALGLNPLADSWDALPAPTMETVESTEYIVMTVTRGTGIEDIDLSGEFSTNFELWESTGVEVSATIDGETETVTVRIPVPSDTGSDGLAPFFVRLTGSEVAE